MPRFFVNFVKNGGKQRIISVDDKILLREVILKMMFSKKNAKTRKLQIGPEK